MTPVCVAIPSIGSSPLLAPLLQQLRQERSVKALRLYDNSQNGVLRHLGVGAEDVVIVEMPGKTIYEEWNDAIEWANGMGGYVALLNDDIELPPGALDEMAHALDDQPELWVVCPDWQMGVAAHRPRKEIVQVTGSLRHHGVCGFCFTLKPYLGLSVEPGYEVWYGDDSLFWEVSAKGGRMARIDGLGVAHAQSSTWSALDWARDAIQRDTARWAATGRP